MEFCQGPSITGPPITADNNTDAVFSIYNCQEDNRECSFGTVSERCGGWITAGFYADSLESSSVCRSQQKQLSSVACIPPGGNSIPSSDAPHVSFMLWCKEKPQLKGIWES